VNGLSEEARRLISGAELVAGGARHLSLAKDLIRGEALAWPSPLDAAFPRLLALRGRPVAVLATGDPFHYGVGKLLAAQVPPEEIHCVPQPSAFSLAAARLGWALQDVACITLHGRPLETLIRSLHPGRRIIALTWDGSTPGKVRDLLLARGFGRSRMTVLERMGSPEERTQSGPAATLDLEGVAALNVVALEIAADADALILPLTPGREDTLFETDGQLTRHEVRAVVLAALAPRYGERLWDIGLGAGSVAIEWLLADPSLAAIGVEENAGRAARARRNALALGTPSLEIVEGRAPEALAGLPAPDAVFIGGGLGEAGVFETAWHALKPGGRLVANAVTLEGEARLTGLAATHGGSLTRLAIRRAEPLGTLTGWTPSREITLWRIWKR